MNLKLILTGVLLGAGTFAMAQKPTTDSRNSLEVQLNLTGDTGTVVTPGMRFRYFVAPNMALRFGLTTSNTNYEQKFTELPNGMGLQGSETTNSRGVTWTVGFEYHFTGTERLSPYVGLSFGMGSGAREMQRRNTDGNSFVEGKHYSDETRYTRLVYGLLLGTDFYVAQNFFVGAECGLTGSATTHLEGESTTTDPLTGTTTTTIPEAKSSSMDFGNIVSIRLGWRF